MAGQSRIGGNFSLVDHDGRPVNNNTFKGKYRLVYFGALIPPTPAHRPVVISDSLGFTFCPDICPIELKKMARIIDELDKEIGPDIIQPIFVSLDPWRDSVEQIKNYVGRMPSSSSQLISLSSVFRVSPSLSWLDRHAPAVRGGGQEVPRLHHEQPPVGHPRQLD